MDITYFYRSLRIPDDYRDYFLKNYISKGEDDLGFTHIFDDTQNQRPALHAWEFCQKTRDNQTHAITHSGTQAATECRPSL